MSHISKELIQAVSRQVNQLSFLNLSLLTCQMGEIWDPAIHTDMEKSK